MKVLIRILWIVLVIQFVYYVGINYVFYSIMLSDLTPSRIFTPFSDTQYAIIKKSDKIYGIVTLVSILIVIFIRVFKRKRIQYIFSGLLFFITVVFGGLYYFVTRYIQADINQRISEEMANSIAGYYSLGGHELPPYFYLEMDPSINSLILGNVLMIGFFYLFDFLSKKSTRKLEQSRKMNKKKTLQTK